MQCNSRSHDYSRLRNFVRFRNFVASPGFTLIEILVSISIFTVAVLSILGVYLTTLRISRVSAARRVVEQNGRFFTEFVSKELRNGGVDYAGYGGSIPALPRTELKFITKDGTPARIFLSTSDLGECKTGSLCLEKLAIFTPITSDDVISDQFDIYLTPATDPYAVSGSPPNEQTRVTLVIGLKSKAKESSGQVLASLKLENTISARQYQR